MKLFLLIIFLLPLSAFARRAVTLQQGIQAISNPGSLTPEVSCEEAIANGGPIPPHCQNLFASVCQIQRSSNRLGDLNQSISQRTYDTLPANATQAQRNAAAEQAIRISDTEAYDNNSQQGPSRDDIRRMMDPARWNIISLFNRVGYPSPERQTQMATTVQNIRLKTGSEYVATLVQWGRQQNPSASQEALRQDALTTYTAACGRTGLEANAFFEEGEIVLCPGLAYSMRDYGDANKIEEIKAAMIFTMSHEISHSIDYLANQSNLDRLVACFQRAAPDASIFNNREKLAEITSDYFGAFSLGKYLADNAVKLGLPIPATPSSANTVMRILARSVGSLCTDDPADNSHPGASYRINQVLARTPGIKSALGCPAPTVENPSCNLRGNVPAQ